MTVVHAPVFWPRASMVRAASGMDEWTNPAARARTSTRRGCFGLAGAVSGSAAIICITSVTRATCGCGAPRPPPCAAAADERALSAHDTTTQMTAAVLMPPIIRAPLRIDRDGHVAAAAQRLRHRRRVVRAREQDVPRSCRRHIRRQVGPAIAVVVALDRLIAGAAPGDVHGRGVVGAGLQSVPQAGGRVVDDE